MPPPIITAIADGQLPHGSFEVTLLESGNIFVLDNFSTDPVTSNIQSKSKSGRKNRGKVIPVGGTFTCDAQVADETSQTPYSRETFAIDADKDGNVEPFQVESSGRKFDSGDVYKCTVKGDQMVNPLIYDTVTNLAPVAPTLTHAVAMAAGNALGAYLPPGVALITNPWSAVGLPAGVVIAAATGILSGTPTTAGNYTVKIKCAGTIIIDGASENRIGVRTYFWVVA